ncbi:glycine--tRNA ligase subunit beta [bacterium]|nr:MAG: glycine--tRNA ligase subunit beta [bacterium]
MNELRTGRPSAAVALAKVGMATTRSGRSRLLFTAGSDGECTTRTNSSVSTHRVPRMNESSFRGPKYGSRYSPNSMPELLLEVGCEELPATFVRKAYTDLAQKLSLRLAELGVGGGEATAMGTPRRLIISIPDVPERQPDETKPTRGPGIKAAYDAEGKPTGALLGFLRGQGVDLSAVRDDGQYIWVDKHIPGRPTAELLAEEIPAAIRGLSFEKSMRWGASRMRFARPLRWLLATYGGAVVPFEIEGVTSGDQSRGHRFYSPQPFSANSLDALLNGLRERHVEPDPAARRRMVEEGARAAAAPGVPDLPESLVEENTFLTEWPVPIAGEFKASFSGLPEPVLVTAMAKHEKMFPIRENGTLTNRFVFVRNSGQDDSVRAGAEWVLNARFNDAKFFAEGDAGLTLDGFLEKTEGILFSERLGTVRQRTERLAKVATAVAAFTGADADAEETELARKAGLYAKADLATGLVSELASLQGIIGGEYARREGMPEPVAFAIARQYDPASIGTPDTPEKRTAWRVVMADALDKLAGYLGLGLAPSGSSDPYALRRAATQLIDAAWAWPASFGSYDDLFDAALGSYEGVELDHRAAKASLHELFANRYPTLLSEVRHDVLNAAIVEGSETTRPQGVRFRARAMTRLVADHSGFVTTATRPLNLVRSAAKKGLEYGVEDPIHRAEHSALESAEGLDLLQTLSEREAPLAAAVDREDVEEAIRLLLELEAPINRFLDGTMILVDQPDVRYARLTLLWAASTLLLKAGDFAKLEG